MYTHRFVLTTSRDLFILQSEQDEIRFARRDPILDLTLYLCVYRVQSMGEVKGSGISNFCLELTLDPFCAILYSSSSSNLTVEGSAAPLLYKTLRYI